MNELELSEDRRVEYRRQLQENVLKGELKLERAVDLLHEVRRLLNDAEGDFFSAQVCAVLTGKPSLPFTQFRADIDNAIEEVFVVSAVVDGLACKGGW